jgi:hypothetical protein
MRRTMWMRGLAVTLAVTAAGAVRERHARAGNGTAPAPTGTIYVQDLSTLDPSTNTVMLHAMDADGGNVTPVLRADRGVRPGRLLRGATAPARWFLTMKTVEGAEVGGNPRRDVYAVRADGAEVRLTSHATTEYWMPEWGSESADLAGVFVLGRRWTSTEPDATVVPGTAGLYRAEVVFDEEGSGVESVRAPVLWTLLFDATVGDLQGRCGAAYLASYGGDTPDVAAYSYSPVAGYLAVQDLDASTPRIRVVSEIEGDAAGFGPFQRWEGQDPSWVAPDAENASRIVYARFLPGEGGDTDAWVIETATDTGQGDFTSNVRSTEASVPLPANAATTQSLGRPRFSTDGNHVAYQLRRHGRGTTNYVLRETGGLGPKNLTPGVKPAAAGETGLVLVDWR